MTAVTKRYHQAEEMATYLLSEIDSVNYDFKELFELFGWGDEVVINDLNQLKLFRNQVKTHLIDSCNKLDHEFFIPGLIEFMSHYYMDRQPEQHIAPALAAKVLIGFLWSNNYNGKPSNGRGITSLVKAHNCCQLFTLIEQFVLAWEFEPLGPTPLNYKGMVENDIYTYYLWSFSKQGVHEYKVINDVVNQVWNNPHILTHLNTQVSGTKAFNKQLFGNTFLSEIPLSHTRFWNRFWTLMHLYAIVHNIKISSGGEYFGVCFIPQLRVLSWGTTKEQRQQDVYDTFWQPEWHKQHISKDYVVLQEMIIHRPMVRVIKTEHIFATSILLLQDAVNLLLEDYLHSTLGDKLYEKYFSNPFETKVLDLLAEHGYNCGEVTMSRTWRRATSDVQLLNKSKMPGQIDVLALSFDQRITLLADCKMLHFPYESRAQRNLRSKFSDDDSEGFYSKLRKKANWLIQCTNDPTKDTELIQLLITHRHIPLPANTKGLVLSFDELEAYLEKGIPPAEWVCGGWNLE
jgi:hypothetical protein